MGETRLLVRGVWERHDWCGGDMTGEGSVGER